MQECIFCQIVGKKAVANVVFENDDCLAFSPLDAVANGHLLVIPKKHFKDLFDIDDHSLAALSLAAKTIASKTAQELGSTGVNLLHASGKDAQQSVFHFHLHLIPRHPDDGLDLWIRHGL